MFLWVGLTFIITTSISWALFDGDISWQRLTSKGFASDPVSFNYLQLAAPVVLLCLTRLKIPVSTTMMILTAIVTKEKTLSKVIMKSLLG